MRRRQLPYDDDRGSRRDFLQPGTIGLGASVTGRMDDKHVDSELLEEQNGPIDPADSASLTAESDRMSAACAIAVIASISCRLFRRRAYLLLSVWSLWPIVPGRQCPVDLGVQFGADQKGKS